jgi:ABC-2 type transport system permease protein
MRAYRTLAVTLGRSNLREPVGLFFTLIFAAMLVVILGLIFGNDPKPEFGGRSYVGATLPAYMSLVMAIMGVLTLPVNQLQLRESGALTRLRVTPLRPRTFVAADLTVNFLIGMAGIVLALVVGMVGFGVRPQGNLVLVLAAAALGLIAFLALGYTLAAIYPSAAAATGIGNGLMILLMLTSGAFVPLAVLPLGVQRVMSFSPIHHLVDLMQGLWSGHAWSDYLPSTGVLLGMIVVFGALGARLFKWNGPAGG